MSDKIIHLTDDSFDTDELKADGAILVDFWAEWCGPCQMVLPVIEELSNELTDVKVGKVNIDEQMELARQFRVMSIPTLMVIKDGKEVKREIGARSREEILEMLL